ncbi:unnamed protein product, partial [Tetraodon nigroviridis]
DTEIVNTAILTGRRLAVPVRVVTVETDGQVREVDKSVTCSSTDVDVVKVGQRRTFSQKHKQTSYTLLHKQFVNVLHMTLLQLTGADDSKL